MEGILLTPPERGTIIGRALWRPRYIVVGSLDRDQKYGSPTPHAMNNSRIDSSLGQSTSSNSANPFSQPMYLSLYKSKYELEAIQQHAIGSITDCQVQMLAHRKQGPVLPTLVINISPDPTTDKLRKRRSSRTAGLTSTKETAPTTLWFRPTVDDPHTLQDWARFIQAAIQNCPSERSPMSPPTPASPTFINSFALANRRPSSGNAKQRPPLLHQKSSSPTHSSRECPTTYSEAPSLRSRRSDMSSRTGSMPPPPMVFQPNSMMLPSDIPSPATTIGEYQGEFIEGWTSAQGRTSALSSPTFAKDSDGSQTGPHTPGPSSSPPGIRETILDRAFQLRCIPGSEREVPGEEKLSSLARFDALMGEAERRRRARKAAEVKLTRDNNDGLKSAWDPDDDSDEENDEDAEDNSDDSEDDAVGDLEADSDSQYFMPAQAQRALDFITGRREPTHPPPRAHGARSPLSYNAETSMAPSMAAHAMSRLGMGVRSHSQPHLPGVAAHSASLESPAAILTSSEHADVAPMAAPMASTLHRSATEKRKSSSSTKRLSFTDFTKRLSSTSSLLLVQTNASGISATSSRSSGDTDSQQQQLQSAVSRTGGGSRGTGTAFPSQVSSSAADRDDKRCGWRGSVGVFGTEGGFL